jgi:hypothetical protein
LSLGIAAYAAEPIRAVVVTGGHDYDVKAFPALFEGNPDIEVVFAAQKDDSELFEDIADWPYDVIVFYNMGQRISEKRRQNFLALLDQGVGVVALHHVMGAFQEWDAFAKIVGAKFLLNDETIGETAFPKSTYIHGVDFTVHIADTAHAITQGVTDFKVKDETYKGCTFEPDNHVLLTTDDPTSDVPIGWVRTYANAQVCTIQPGHGPQIFSDPSFKRLVTQAIRFCAREDKPK